MGASGALAVSFLTVLPVRLPRDVPPLGAAAVWFPVVGALIGAAAGGVRAGTGALVGPSTSAVLAVATMVLLTGALHQDGLADCADGLGVRGDRARRLEVMRDSAIGVFGALALLVWMLLVVVSLAGLESGEAVCALVLATVAGRWAALVHARLARPARPEGLGASFDVGGISLAVASVLTVVAAVLLAGAGRGLAAIGGALVVTMLVTGWSRATLGGRTGDTLGAAVALAEAVVLVVLLGFATS